MQGIKDAEDRLRNNAMLQEHEVFIGIGSNLGNRLEIACSALRLLDATPECRLIRCSSWYETEPVGIESEYWFLNAVASFRTLLDPYDFMELLLDTEQRLGRLRAPGCMDRTIDLDLLYYQGVVAGYGPSFLEKTEGSVRSLPEKKEHLVVPHPSISQRRFVLEPWAEIAPDLVVEPPGMSVEEMLHDLESGGPVVRKMQHSCPDF